MINGHLSLFEKAFEEVLHEIGFADLTYKAAPEMNPPSEAVATIGITGDIQGFLLLRSDTKSLVAFISKVLANMGMEESEEGFGSFQREAFGEILNQLSGRSVMLLADHGFECDITPPTLLIGANISYDIRALDDFLNQDISGGFGKINIFVGIKKAKEWSKKS
ncbi:chemotaxis protein CheX [Sediminispirochaeta bajacaliforniensis]|jgi:chemotaxis protein CheX|uniref:chemotaxis protein CheX n=1 Tax=Sediminispirochaeta bajacaliforniensis TaxID=148 RepID=UPI00036A3235|nr:chemotaxis protein CheX [Sediminispirochaeta bajacaliforniensis]